MRLLWLISICALGFAKEEEDSFTYQDAFCLSSSEPTDPRYKIISFALLKSQLLVFTPVTFFQINLTEVKEPPFQVYSGLRYSGFYSNLSNYLTQTYAVNSQLATTVGIDIDDVTNLLLIHTNINGNYDTIPLIWNINNRYIQSEFEVHASFQSQNSEDNHFVSGSGYFYHFNKGSIVRYDVGEKLDLSARYFELVQTDDSYLLVETDTEVNNGTDEADFVRNGFIYDSKLYMTNGLTIDVYLVELNGLRFRYSRSIASNEFIKCIVRKNNRDFFILTIIFTAIYFLSILMFSVLSVIFADGNGHRFIQGPNLNCLELTEELRLRTKID